MRFRYCPHCGTKAIQKEIGDEGLMAYCPTCKKPLFDMADTCVIALVVNEKRQVALIRQNYVSTEHYVSIAGHIKLGENGETSIAREVEEEIGQKVERITYLTSVAMKQKEQLMLCYLAEVKKQPLVTSVEVDQAAWFSYDEALEKATGASVVITMLKQCRDYFTTNS